ncbi:MAG: O-antigen ligase family protein [Caldilineaceae bacterium]
MLAFRQLRQPLALVRLGLLFALFCLLLVALGLAQRARQEAGAGLDQPLPPVNVSIRQLPFLGINVMLEQYTPTERRAALARLKADGFGWVRQRLDWGQLEPAQGQYRWAWSDALLQDVAAQGLVPVVVLDGSPTWARGPLDVAPQANPFAPPADFVTFARFAAAFAQRYQDKVHFYQLWDEPNLAPHWGNHHIEPVEYAQLLKVTTSAIRAVDPNAVIITAALAPTADRGHTAIDEVYFLQRLYAAGAAPYFDAVAVEPFGFGYAPDDPHEQNSILNFQRIKLVRRAMLAAGDGTKPIWAVRYGWNIRQDSPWGTVRPEDQVKFAVQAVTIARTQWPWLAALGWMIDQPSQGQGDPVWGFALTPAVAEAMRGARSKEQGAGGEGLGARSRGQGARGWGLGIGIGSALWVIWAGFLVVGWRGVTAARILPWATWIGRYRAGAVWVKMASWAVLLLVYSFATWPPLILGCWVMASLLCVAQPQAGLWLVGATLPFYFQHKEIDWGNGSWTVAPVHALLLCLLPALGLVVARAKHVRLETGPTPKKTLDVFASLRLCVKSFHPFDWFALTWLVLTLLTSVNVWPWSAYQQGLWELAVLPLLGYAAVRLLGITAQQRYQLMIALFVGGFCTALLGLVDWGRGNGVAVDGVLRLVGPYFSPNQTALFLVRALFLGVGLAMATNALMRYAWFSACAVVVAALILTASRGALFLGLPAGVVLFVWLGLRRRAAQAESGSVSIFVTFPFSRRWLLGLFLLTLVILGIGISIFWARLTNLTTANQRLITWQATWRLWRTYPLLGVGPGGFFWRYPAFLTQVTAEPNLEHPHNVWLEFAASWGSLGLLWLGGLLATVVNLTHHSSLITRHAWLTLGLLAALIAGLAHGQVDAFAVLPDLAMWLWLVLGLLGQEGSFSKG